MCVIFFNVHKKPNFLLLYLSDSWVFFFCTGTCILCFTDTYEKQLEGGDVGEDFSDTDIDFAR